MLDPTLVAAGAEILSNPPLRTEATDRIAFTRVVAGSHRLEGIDPSVEQVLEAADTYAPRLHAAAS